MNTPERMEVELRDGAWAEAFDLVLRAAAIERRCDPGSMMVRRAREIILMRHARLGRYLEAVRR